MSRKLKHGQTYNKVKAFVFGFDWWERFDISVFGERLSGSMGSMEVSNFDRDFLHMEEKEGVFCFLVLG